MAEGKRGDADRLIATLHEGLEPQVFGSVTVAEQSQVLAEATLRNYPMWKVKN